MTKYPKMAPTDPSELNKKDFQTDQDVRWCPGCGDYSILAQVQRTLPTLGVPKEDFVFISGIGCSSRFPYYMDTFGMHSIHGRAPAIATGVKSLRPNLKVWVITGDGDSLSIGGNHLIHMLRRNVDLKVILFNNRIYGLTKGQYSPTSEQGKQTKSSPLGSLDYPFNPIALMLGADATFVARSIDTDAKGLQSTLKRMHAHQGTAVVEIFQNCNIFNDGVFSQITDRKTKADQQLPLIHGQPLRFGAKGEKGIALDGMTPIVVDTESHGVENLLVHDEGSVLIAQMLARMTYPEFPTPVGVFRAVNRPSYDALLQAQIDEARAARPGETVQDMLNAGLTWVVE